MKISSKDGSKVMTVIASPGQGPDRSTEVSYTDTKVRFFDVCKRVVCSTFLKGSFSKYKFSECHQSQLRRRRIKFQVKFVSFH